MSFYCFIRHPHKPKYIEEEDLKGNFCIATCLFYSSVIYEYRLALKKNLLQLYLKTSIFYKRVCP